MMVFGAIILWSTSVGREGTAAPANPRKGMLVDRALQRRVGRTYQVHQESKGRRGRVREAHYKKPYRTAPRTSLVNMAEPGNQAQDCGHHGIEPGVFGEETAAGERSAAILAEFRSRNDHRLAASPAIPRPFKLRIRHGT